MIALISSSTAEQLQHAFVTLLLTFVLLPQ
jgi:hypothetical protein